MNNLEIEEPEFQDKWEYTGEKEAEWEEAKRLRIRSSNTLDESLPKQEPRWIPFSERLPEHGQLIAIIDTSKKTKNVILEWVPEKYMLATFDNVNGAMSHLLWHPLPPLTEQQ
jgi:hypothetical protein